MGKKNKDKNKDKKANKSSGEQRSFTGSLALSKLKHVIMKKKNKKGKKIKMICIPIEANFLIEGKDNAVYMPIRVIAKNEEDQYGNHGFISQSVDSKAWKAADDELQDEMRKTPILGNIKDWEFEKGSSNDSSGSMSDGEIDEDDDLPF